MIVSIYNSLYSILSHDQEILNYLQLGSSPTALQLAKKIVKQSRPQEVLNLMPLVTFYNMPSRRQRTNFLVYDAVFHFDIYTGNDVNTAHLIAQRIFELLEDRIVLTTDDTETLTNWFVDSYEFVSGFQNVYSYRSIFQIPTTIGNYSN